MNNFNQPLKQNNHPDVPKHGGNLGDAIGQYNIAREQWLDLSTGVSPWAWPIPKLAEHVWTDLPPSTNELLISASNYYRCEREHIIASPGSQLIARLIPQQIETSNVAIPVLGYQEHRHSWELAGHTIHFYQSTSELNTLIDSKKVEHAVVINPNNPTGELITAVNIDRIAKKLSGLLIVDEAFMDIHEYNQIQTNESNESDTTPDSTIESAIAHPHDNQIVLRSVGKFFGLAGLRVGFAVGKHPIIKTLEAILEPWSLNHASQLIATKMLNDTVWQQSQALKIKSESKHFENIIRGFSHITLNNFHISNGGLFITLFANKKSLQQTHRLLAEYGIWTRLHNPDDQQAWLRFSLTQQPMKCQAVLEKIINVKK